jgi:hypothetical protein
MTTSAALRSFDRRFFAFTAIGFVLLVLAGFARTYYFKAFFGAPPLPSRLVHLHGLLMTAWVALFATQVWLISSRQVKVHQRLGYAGVGLAVLIVAAGLVTAMRAGKYGSPSMPPNIPSQAFMAIPLFDLLMFSMLFGAALYFRKRPAAHKSLMLLTAINFVPPAIARIPIAALQSLGPLWFFGFPTVLMLVCLAIDWRRRGQVNTVFLAGSLLLIASYPVRLALMGTAGWMQFAVWLTSLV